MRKGRRTEIDYLNGYVCEQGKKKGVKTPYNDANPTVDVAGQFRADETAQLTSLFNALGDNLVDIGLRLCARTT